MAFSKDFFHWAPRILCIIAILFISAFAADAFAPGVPPLQQIEGFLIHLIPSFVLIVLLRIAWKRELAGGIIFTFIGVAMSPLIFLHNRNVNHFTISQSINSLLLITFPFIIAGILFLESHHIRKKNNSNHNSSYYF
jgi:hypothetical protein